MAIWLLLGLAAYLGLACTLQRRLLFPGAGALAPAAAVPPEVRAVRLGADAAVEAWYLAVESTGERGPALIFAHGNAELIDDWHPAFEVPRRWGVSVLLVEYPGYGRSRGSPSEASIAQTMTEAYDFLTAQPEIDPARIVGYGRSLGGGAVCALARRRPLAALVLESTFTSVRPFARRFGLFGPLLLDPFENLDALRSFAGPALIVHGAQDAIVPVAHGRQLARAAAKAEYHEIEDCGHNDCPRPWPLLRAFLERHALLPR